MENLPANNDEKDLEPTPLAVVDAAYEMDGFDNDFLDLGMKLGRMRVTERIGGFFRPVFSREVCRGSLRVKTFNDLSCLTMSPTKLLFTSKTASKLLAGYISF